ncbi:MAG: DUF3810 family protein [Vicinamibacterales bacterium]
MRLSPKPLIQIVLVGVAASAAYFRIPPSIIERYYAGGVYQSLQGLLTEFSNRVSVPLFDILIVLVAVVAVGGWILWIRAARKKRSFSPILRGFGWTLTGAAVIYLWFLGTWGFNYSRPPLETVMAFDASRVTPIAVRELAERAVRETNAGYRAAHDAGFPAIAEVPTPLVDALHAVERQLGRSRPTRPAHPKHSMWSPFFRATGVSGMIDPFFLETLINPDLTGPERPAVLAHEWAHLSGFAPESDASFVGYLAALRADSASQYSAWLALVSEAASQLQPVTRDLVLKDLDAGPRADQQAINKRLEALIRPVERAAWKTYDQMLKSQGVPDGVRSYSRVIRLLIGTGALAKVEPKGSTPPASRTP